MASIVVVHGQGELRVQACSSAGVSGARQRRLLGRLRRRRRRERRGGDRPPGGGGAGGGGGGGTPATGGGGQTQGAKVIDVNAKNGAKGEVTYCTGKDT